MSKRTSTSEMTVEEITYARALDKLEVDADGLGSVPTEWLENWRSKVRRGPSGAVTSWARDRSAPHPLPKEKP